MKKILFLLIPINIFCQATKVSELPVATTATDNSFTIMNVGGTPDTTKRITTSNLWNYFLYKDTATNILATRYWVTSQIPDTASLSTRINARWDSTTVKQAIGDTADILRASMNAFWDSATVKQYVTDSAGGGSPGGSNAQIQYNNSGEFGASSNLTFTTASNTLSIGATASWINEITPSAISISNASSQKFSANPAATAYCYTFNTLSDIADGNVFFSVRDNNVMFLNVYGNGSLWLYKSSAASAAPGTITRDNKNIYFGDDTSKAQTLVQAAYGSLWFYNESSATLPYTTSWDTFECYDTARAGLVKYTNVDTVYNEIDIITGGDGIYDVEYSVSYNLNNQRIETAIFKNNTELLKESASTSGIGQTGDITATGKARVRLNKNDKVEIKYKFSGGSGTAGFDALRLSIDRVDR